MAKDITLNITIECMKTMEVGYFLCVASSIGEIRNSYYGAITMISYVTHYKDVEPPRSDNNPIKYCDENKLCNI